MDYSIALHLKNNLEIFEMEKEKELEDAMIDFATKNGTDTLAYYLGDTLLRLLNPEENKATIRYNGGHVNCVRYKDED